MQRFRSYFLLCLVLIICSLGAATAFAQSCVHATGGTSPTWVNTPFASQTGTFTATFDATPSLSNMNSVVALSHGAGTSYAAFANLVAFNGTQGVILARNGGTYASQTNVPYSGGVTYHFRLVVNVPAHTYSIFVTPPGSAELTIGNNYAFRTEQNTVTSLDNYGVFVGATSGTLTVCNFAIGTGGDFSLTATPASQTVTAGGSTTYTVTIGASGGFSGNVALSASGLPAGASAGFSPGTVSGSGSSTVTVTTSGSTPAGNSTITLTGTSGGLTHSANVTLTVNQLPDFTVSASPSSQSVQAGNSTSYTVNVGALNGFSGSVTLSASGLPSGASGSFTSNPVSGSGTSTLMVTTTTATTTGTATIVITGTSGSTSHTANVSLTVTAPPQPDFTISTTQSSQTVTAGGSTSYTVNLGAINGFNSDVTLSASGLPSGATASFTTNPVAGGSGSSTLDVSTSTSTPGGNSAITITGTGGGLTHSTSVQLIVNTSGGGTPNGNPVLTPKWTYGILWGSYHNQSQVLSDMNMLRNGHYGGDLYWIDSSWLSSSYTGTPQDYICFKFDPVQFPDPATMIGTLRQNHFWFGVWEWPWMDQGCGFFSHGVSNHFFIDDTSGNVVNAGGWHGNTFTGAFDYTNPGTVSWWRSLNQPLANMGLSFYKLDTGGGYPSGGVTDDGKNSQDEYKFLYRKTAYDFGAIVNGGRGFVLTHTQGATHTDQTPGMWTGDTSASFSGLASEMHTASGLNNSTHTPFYCGDTGGYNNTPTSELYIRWLEYTTFTPCQEYFGAKTTSTGARFPWMFSTQAQQIALQYSQLRYQLLPFRYSNAQQQYHVLPLQYTSFWIGSTQLVNGIGNSQILVQPVTTSGATSATVALPSGANWIDYWTGTVHTGGTSVTVPAPINHIPMLVKAGSIIPMGPVQEWVGQLPDNPITLDIYPAGSTSYTLYEDDGTTLAYMGGAFSTTTFTSNNTSGHEMVSIGAANGSFNGMLSSRTYLLKINQQASSPAGVTRDGNAETQLSSQAAFDAASEGWFFDSTAHIVWVKFTISTSTATSVALQ